MVLKELASAAELGTLIGIATRGVRDLAARGVIPKTKRGKYRVVEAVPAYCAHMRGLLSGRGGETAAVSGSTERARLAKEQADAIALKNAAARGALLDAGEVERAWTADYAAVRAGVLAASSRIASRLPHLDVTDISTIDDELRNVLTERGEGKP